MDRKLHAGEKCENGNRRKGRGELEVTTELPQGPSVSPIIFLIYVSRVHQAGEGGGAVRSLSFIDGITWITHGRS